MVLLLKSRFGSKRAIRISWILPLLTQQLTQLFRLTVGKLLIQIVQQVACVAVAELLVIPIQRVRHLNFILKQVLESTIPIGFEVIKKCFSVILGRVVGLERKARDSLSHGFNFVTRH